MENIKKTKLTSNIIECNTIAVCDVHLGAKNSERKRFRKFLHRIRKGNKIVCQRLILLGDIFDSCNPKKLKKQDWKVIKQLRKIIQQQKIEVIFVKGNHDHNSRFIMDILDIGPVDTFILQSGLERVFCCHGHNNDSFINKHPVLTNFADGIYAISQMIDPSHKLARFLKKSSKAFLKCAKKIGVGISVLAKENNCTIGIFGHTHYMCENTIDGIKVFNPSAWVEKPCHFLTIINGIIEIKEFK